MDSTGGHWDVTLGAATRWNPATTRAACLGVESPDDDIRQCPHPDYTVRNADQYDTKSVSRPV